MSEGFLVYALKEGGAYKVKRATKHMFDEVIAAQGEMLEQKDVYIDGTAQYRIVRPTYIAWAPIAADFDFVLGGPRESR